MNNIFLPFIPEAKVNYLYLLKLYQMAQYRKNTNAYDYIYYSSIPKLAEALNISTSTLNRILNDQNYLRFFTVDRKNKCILLNNSFKGVKNTPFVILTLREMTILEEAKDNLFCKYLIYVKYFCGYSKKPQDFTAKQFLATFGYSTNSNNLLSKISKFNGLLSSFGVVEITKTTDEKGHTRNIYRYK